MAMETATMMTSGERRYGSRLRSIASLVAWLRCLGLDVLARIGFLEHCTDE
jgi:hypothetical protein